MSEVDLYQGHEFNLNSLFNEDIKFRIPIYQRNYAWGGREIEQLLKDISENKDAKYYLGTLVLYENGDFYDVIDGQQRITTLFLLMQWLSKEKQMISDGKGLHQLYFESRPKTRSFIELLKAKDKKSEVIRLCETFEGLNSFTSAISVIQKFFEKRIENVELNNFEQSLKKTHLFATALPKKTNVNHYFEIMNNRGEQLEQHEILKARLLDRLADRYDKGQFSKLWDACSQMDNHAQYYMDVKARQSLFGDDYNNFPSDEIVESFIHSKDIDKPEDTENTFENPKTPTKKKTGISILKNHIVSDNFKQELDRNKDEKFQSIIDFENFLLHVLSIYTGTKINLEDKNLISNFENVQDLSPFDFIKKLLQVRFLFDKYVVKREIDENIGDWNWVIKDFERDSKSFVQNNTFEDRNENRKMVMLQSMFQVSYSTNTNKTWLRNLLEFLIRKEYGHFNDLDANLWNEMKTRYNSFVSKEHEKSFTGFNGLDTPRAIFNFLDYLLWLKYWEVFIEKSDPAFESEPNGLFLKAIGNLKEKFDRFKFVQRNSIEHLFPQSKIGDLEMNVSPEGSKEETINSFGNLCLISSSSNSTYNKEHPKFKKSKATGKNESLKQQIMFDMMEGGDWNQKKIEMHHKEAMDLLNENLKEVSNFD